MPDRPKRFQSQTERDLEGVAAAKERTAEAEAERLERTEHSTPVEIPIVVYDEITGQYEGVELDARRERRPTPERILRLERKADKHDDKIDALQTTVGTMSAKLGEVSGKLDILPDLVRVVSKIADRGADREHVTFTAQVDVDKARQQGDIKIETAKKLDVLGARAERRKRLTKIIGAVAASGVLGALVHWLATC